MKPSELTADLCRDLLRYLAATSEERARLIGELSERNPGMADVLMDLEADGARFEIELLRSSDVGPAGLDRRT